MRMIAFLFYTAAAAVLHWLFGSEPGVALAKSSKFPGSGKGIFGPLSDEMVPDVPKPPKAPTPPPKPVTPLYDEDKTRQAADEAARKAILDERRRRAGSTVVTSPLGVTTAAPVAKKTLLGG